jgi:hypothetical protein
VPLKYLKAFKIANPAPSLIIIKNQISIWLQRKYHSVRYDLPGQFKVDLIVAASLLRETLSGPALLWTPGTPNQQLNAAL